MPRCNPPPPPPDNWAEDEADDLFGPLPEASNEDDFDDYPNGNCEDCGDPLRVGETDGRCYRCELSG